MRVATAGNLVAAAALAIAAAAHAVPVTLIDENFDDVSVLNAVQVQPFNAVLGALPAGTSVIANGGALPTWTNVRRHDNLIDSVGLPGSTSFDDFFSAGNFAVLGDSAGNLAGDEAGTSGFLIPFVLPVGTTSLSVSFAYVFDANALNNLDTFSVAVVNANAPLSALSVTGPIVDGATRNAAFSVNFNAAQLAALAGATSLRFQLGELAGGGSSGVGIDNILLVADVNLAPVPATLALLAAGLLALAWRARVRMRARYLKPVQRLSR